eukprot:31542-Pelagococcus_subviridis.AAC.6
MSARLHQVRRHARGGEDLRGMYRVRDDRRAREADNAALGRGLRRRADLSRVPPALRGRARIPAVQGSGIRLPGCEVHARGEQGREHAVHLAHGEEAAIENRDTPPDDRGPVLLVSKTAREGPPEARRRVVHPDVPVLRQKETPRAVLTSPHVRQRVHNASVRRHHGSRGHRGVGQRGVPGGQSRHDRRVPGRQRRKRRRGDRRGELRYRRRVVPGRRDIVRDVVPDWGVTQQDRVERPERGGGRRRGRDQSRRRGVARRRREVETGHPRERKGAAADADGGCARGHDGLPVHVDDDPAHGARAEIARRGDADAGRGDASHREERPVRGVALGRAPRGVARADGPARGVRAGGGERRAHIHAVQARGDDRPGDRVHVREGGEHARGEGGRGGERESDDAGAGRPRAGGGAGVIDRRCRA